jgi:hypothetical protein
MDTNHFSAWERGRQRTGGLTPSHRLFALLFAYLTGGAGHDAHGIFLATFGLL